MVLSHSLCSLNFSTKYLMSLFIILRLSNLILGAFSEEISKTILLSEKTLHLHFYFHDTLSGKHPSAVKIAHAKGSTDGFGTTFMIDDPLTEEKEITSKVVGRAQGIYAIASQNFPELLMVVNYVFTRGKYNGSSISVLGRNPVMSNVREMPIVGGTGLFRLARGYALAHTIWVDPGTRDAIVEYNVYVMHGCPYEEANL